MRVSQWREGSGEWRPRGKLAQLDPAGGLEAGLLAAKSKPPPDKAPPHKKGAVDFWGRGVWVVGLYLFQGVFAEDVVLAMNAQGENLSWFISLLTVASQFSVAYLSIMLRHKHDSHDGGAVPVNRRFTLAYFVSRYRWEYGMSGLSTVLYAVMSNRATIFLNFNTVQLFKTSKIAYVMAQSWVLLHHAYSLRATMYSISLCAGLYVLSRADVESTRKAHVSDVNATEQLATLVQGFSLMFVSMLFIALSNVLQEAVLRQHVWSWPWRRNNEKTLSDVVPLNKRKAHQVKDELIFFCNLVTSVVLFAGAVYHGELVRGFAFFRRNSARLVFEQAVILCINAFGQRLMLDLSHLYGSTSATIVVTVRKTITFALSVLFFPKPFSVTHGVALIVVSVAACLLQLQIMADERRPRKTRAKEPPPSDGGIGIVLV